MKSESEIRSSKKKAEKKLRQNNARVESFQEGIVDGYEKVLSNPTEERCIKLMRKANRNQNLFETMGWTFGWVPVVGQDIIEECAYYDGMLMAVQDAFDGTLTHENDRLIIESTGGEKIRV